MNKDLLKYETLLTEPINELLRKLMTENLSEEFIFKILKKRSAKLNNPDTILVEKRLKELSDNGFIIENQDDQIWIKKKQFFPIEVVSDFLYLEKKGYQQVVKVLNDKQINLLKKKGFGITSYKFTLSQTFLGNIFCDGCHPNLEPSSSKFCVPQELRIKDPTMTNIAILEESFTQAVLHRSFFLGTSKEIDEIRRLIV